MKFLIKDEEGKTFEIEEVEETKDNESCIPGNKPEMKETKDEESLTSEEISALKALAAVSDKIVAFFSEKETEDSKKDEKEEKETEKEKEKVVETESKDSKTELASAVGSTKSKDSNNVVTENLEEEICKAWANRGGKH